VTVVGAGGGGSASALPPELPPPPQEASHGKSATLKRIQAKENGTTRALRAHAPEMIRDSHEKRSEALGNY